MRHVSGNHDENVINDIPTEFIIDRDRPRRVHTSHSASSFIAALD